MKQKTQTLKTLLQAGGDLGGKTVTELMDHMEADLPAPSRTDPVSRIIYDAVKKSGDHNYEIIREDLNYAVAQLKAALNCFPTGQEEECLANARLMAASPRLLKTLVGIINWHRAHEAISFMETKDIEEAEALIKEVLGEPMQS